MEEEGGDPSETEFRLPGTNLRDFCCETIEETKHKLCIKMKVGRSVPGIKQKIQCMLIKQCVQPRAQEKKAR